MREQEARHPEYAYERSMSPCLLAGEMVRRALTVVSRICSECGTSCKAASC